MSQKRPTPVAQHANKARQGKVLVAPVVSEKASSVAQKHNQVVFTVLREPNKAEIKAAVELLFKVEVQGVTVNDKQGKAKRQVGRQHRVLKPALASTRIASEDLDAAVQSVAG